MVRQSTLAVPVILAAVLTMAVAPGAAHPPSEPACNNEVCNVDIVNLAFAPQTIRVRPGATVVWVNHDIPDEAAVGPHDVTSGGPDNAGGPLRSGLLYKEGEYRFTFQTAGEYPYYCTIHPFMHGKVIVSGQPIPEFVSVGVTLALTVLSLAVLWRRIRPSEPLRGMIGS